MTKFTLCLIAIALGAVLEVCLAGSIGRQKNPEAKRRREEDQFRFRGNQIGSANGKCAALGELIPDPTSGCCGRHAEQKKDKKDAEPNQTNIDEKKVDYKPDENGNNEISPSVADSEFGGSIINDVEKKKYSRGSAKCIDVGGIVNDVVNNVIDNIRDRVTTWISKFSNREAQSARKSQPNEIILSLEDGKITINEITNDYNSNSPELSSASSVGFIADAEENNIDEKKVAYRPNNEISPSDADSELGGGIINDVEKNNYSRGSVKCIDIGGIVNDVVNNVIDNIRDRVTTWISKFSDKEAQSARKSQPNEIILSLEDGKITINEITNDYNSNSPGLSSANPVGFITDDEENNFDEKKVAYRPNVNGNNEISSIDADFKLGGEIINDVEKKNNSPGSAKCIDVGGIVSDVVNNVIDNIRDRVTTWISKFSDREAQSARKSQPNEIILSLEDGKITINEITKDNNSNSPGLSSASLVGFIAEGKQAGLHQYPWLVRITIEMDNSPLTMVTTCGGSLISPRFILTAADCVNKPYKSFDDINIYLGEYNINTSSDCVGETCIENVMMHPDKIIVHEDFGYKLNVLFNDIALMRLSGSAPYTEYIRPICLPPFNIDVPKNEGSNLEVAGWGRSDHRASPIMQAAQAQLVSQSQCKKYYSQLTPRQICAVGRTVQNTCHDDSGAPLMMEKDGSFYLVGVISGKGIPSCGSSKPGLYTNVFAYTKWILDNMNV